MFGGRANHVSHEEVDAVIRVQIVSPFAGWMLLFAVTNVGQDGTVQSFTGIVYLRLGDLKQDDAT